MLHDQAAIGEITDLLSEIKRRDVSVELGGSDDFMRALNMDSLDAVELTMHLNERFGIEFGAEADDLEALESLQALAALVQRRSLR